MSMPHWVTDDIAALTPVIALVYFIYKMLTKNTLLEFGRKIDANIATLTQAISNHVVSDEQKHKAIDGHLEATDERVTRIENKVWT